MPFEEAVGFFRDKIPMTAAEYEALVGEVGAYADSLAFTVSGIASADVLQDLHGEVLKALEEGGTFFEFREGIDEIMARRGWHGMTPYRLDNIFRTNIQTAYNVGRHKQMKAVADRRPYWEYDAVNDTHTRPSHLAHDGKVYHHEHAFWHTWYPTNGYRCRCRVNSISREEMEAEGLKEETQVPDLQPDPGFRYNPAVQKWRPDLKKYPDQLVTEFKKKAETIDEAVSDTRARIKAAEKASQYDRIITQKLGERYGFKGKVRFSPKARNYADDLAEGILLAFEDLPAGLRHDIAIKNIRLRPLAKKAGLKEWVCDISVDYFMPVANVKRTTIHEIGHGMHHSLPQSYRDKWVDSFKGLPEELFPSSYSKTDPCEFFAESFTTYCEKKALHPQVQELMEDSLKQALNEISEGEAMNMVRGMRNAGRARHFYYR